jgi:hypothetical protein
MPRLLALRAETRSRNRSRKRWLLNWAKSPGAVEEAASYIIDVEIATEEQLPTALDVIRNVLRQLRVPPSTVIRRHRPAEVVFPVYT